MCTDSGNISPICSGTSFFPLITFSEAIYVASTFFSNFWRFPEGVSSICVHNYHFYDVSDTIDRKTIRIFGEYYNKLSRKVSITYWTVELNFVLFLDNYKMMRYLFSTIDSLKNLMDIFRLPWVRIIGINIKYFSEITLGDSHSSKFFTNHYTTSFPTSNLENMG